MKKYVIKNSDGTKQDVMLADHDTYKKAVDELIEYIDLYNSDTDSGDDNYVSPFDFIIEEVEFTDTNELITGFWRAQRFLDIHPNDDIEVYGKKGCLTPEDGIIDIRQLVNEANPKYIKKLIALNRLYTIMDAWNKKDKFIPDNLNSSQTKWYPYFVYDKNNSEIKFGGTSFADTFASDVFVFKSSKRAKQFGEQFIELFNKAFL